MSKDESGSRWNWRQGPAPVGFVRHDHACRLVLGAIGNSRRFGAGLRHPSLSLLLNFTFSFKVLADPHAVVGDNTEEPHVPLSHSPSTAALR